MDCVCTAETGCRGFTEADVADFAFSRTLLDRFVKKGRGTDFTSSAIVVTISSTGVFPSRRWQ